MDYIAEGHEDLTELRRVMTNGLAKTILRHTDVERLEDVTMQDLHAAFLHDNGADRLRGTQPQLATRSNRGAYDRRVLPTQGALLREQVAAVLKQVRKRERDDDDDDTRGGKRARTGGKEADGDDDDMQEAAADPSEEADVEMAEEYMWARKEESLVRNCKFPRVNFPAISNKQQGAIT